MYNSITFWTGIYFYTSGENFLRANVVLLCYTRGELNKKSIILLKV